MAWCDVLGHDAVAERFRRSLERGRLASTYLFIGPPGIGKRTFAVRLAQALLCQVHAAERCLPCGGCSACQQVAAGSHPDLEIVSKPPDKSELPIELLIGDRAHRMREGLCARIALKPFCGGRKIAIIDDADDLNVEGANCLLKTLEEPPPRSLLILIGTSEQRQLPTIRSRCQVVRFSPLSRKEVADVLLCRGFVSTREEAERLADYGEGSVQQALDSAGPEVLEFRRHLFHALADFDRKPTTLASEVNAFVDRAGKEAGPRRDRLRYLIAQAGNYYRHVMRNVAGAGSTADASLANAARQGSSSWPGDAESAAACLERCLDAEAHVDANASLVAVVECWLDDLARLARGG